MSVAVRLKEIISDAGMTYTALSKKTGISVDALSRSFLEKRKLRADEMIAICTVMNIDLSDLRGAVHVPIQAPPVLPAQ